jgi:anti-sigma regulatory factor (Ser/Thr protein kinase)
VTYASAGHPPPLVVAPQGPHFLEGGRAVPLGTADPASFREAQVTVPPGSTLLLYTDGLIERRDTPLDDRLAQLAAVAEVAGTGGVAEGELAELCDEVLAGVLAGTEPPDDVAVLAVRPEPVRADRLTLTLTAEPETLALLRRRLTRFLNAAGASDDERYEIVLTVSEAAGNAIEHAYGPGDAQYQVEATMNGSEIVVEVRDSGSWRERRGEERGRGLRIMDGLMDDVELAPGPSGTTVRMRRTLGARVAAPWE